MSAVTQSPHGHGARMRKGQRLCVLGLCHISFLNEIQNETKSFLSIMALHSIFAIKERKICKLILIHTDETKLSDT